ncbi:GNAT family N-acetyltransferase [Mumia zhuanghuii]|uniref:N-acetyltransferase family protein n=1 Tax=Mumia zhuanghuii TaxID=2585211 RepID=A0A5C4MDK5_9ACTN|nr:GNAT family N-acetyltransferase [Mumia zhuanghuii]TNC38833.1 N-acetyltransferase family protein [Mumia zhuanghuii]TNC51788.1 N-acetyltransferase family protein [Mumia zhuanghuii]
MTFAIRDATSDDAATCAAIYAPYVRDTAITFETEPPSPATMAARIETAQQRHAWLVLSEDGAVNGYAYGTEFKSRPAYAWSCEVSVYLARDHQPRSGAGRALYEALLPRLADLGFRTLLAGITLPNAASLGLHSALGFQPVGTLRRIGWKHDAWHDVAWMQRSIGDDSGSPTTVEA